jgi:hypothetical protein
MFASEKGPFGGGGSEIKLEWTLTFAPNARPPTPFVNVYVAFLDSDTLKTVGRDDMDGSGELVRDYCCTSSTPDCGPGVSRGGLISFPPAPGGRVPPSKSWIGITTDSTAGPANGSASTSVTIEGQQWLLVVVCDAKGLFPLPPGTVNLQASFRNPYGFLPGQYYGMLPWTGFLFVSYTLLALMYSLTMCVRRKDVIGLQVLVLLVILVGVLEMVVSFAMYDSKNKTGIPTPCNVCPTTSDYLASIVLANFKRAFSRVLMLAVARGYGVVHSNLSLRLWAGLVALGVCYIVLGTLNEVERDLSYSLEPSSWEIPLILLDMGAFFITWQGLEDMRKELLATRQMTKLRMYVNLWRIILSQVAVYVIVAAIVIAVRQGYLPFPWKSLFFLVRFWDLLYLTVLLAVAWIWRPGPDTAQYAYYAQPASEDEDAEEETTAGPDASAAVARPESIGIELVGPSGGSKGGRNEERVPESDDFVIDNSEGDGDLSRGAFAGSGEGTASGKDQARLTKTGGEAVDDRPLSKEDAGRSL